MSRKSRYEAVAPQVLPKRWKIGAYIRLSREDEDIRGMNSESVETQKRIIDKHMKSLEDAEIVGYYIDDGYSGTSLERPDFCRLQADYENKVINCIIVKDLSRLARNNEDAGKLIFVIFPFYNIRFISVNDKVDSYLAPNSVHNLTIHFKNIMNDEYSRDLSKKIRSASAARRRRGEFLGAFAPYGYKKDTENIHQLVIDEEVSCWVEFIYKKFLDGLNYTQIARELTDLGAPTPLAHKKKNHPKFGLPKEFEVKLWSATTVKSILTSDVYIGNLTQSKYAKVSYKSKTVRMQDEQKWITVENTHEAIISKEDFDTVQEIIRSNRRTKSPPTQQNPLAGIIKCGRCKRVMAITEERGKGAYRAYYCTTYHKHKDLCERNRISVSVIENTVLEVLNQHLRLCGEMSKALSIIDDKKQKQNNASDSTSKINELKQKKTALYQDYKNGNITENEYKEKRKQLEAAISSLEGVKETNENNTVLFPEENQFLESFKGKRKFKKLTREIATTFLKSVCVYSPEQIEIELNYTDELKEVIDYISENEHLLENKAVLMA